MTRDEYNTAILSEAHACLDDAEQAELEDGDCIDEDADDDEIYAGEDLELVGQIGHIDDLCAAHATPAQIDAAIDHLREMLLISYLDDSDLPPVVRREPGAPPTTSVDAREWVSGVIAHVYWYATRLPMTEPDAVRHTLGTMFNALPYGHTLAHVSGPRWQVSVPKATYDRWEREGAPVSMLLAGSGAVEFDITL